MRQAAVVDLLIGEFARRCRLPVSTLRYYDRIGLLTPATVDESSGYRRYHPDQLATAELIARLRALDVAPAQIAVILGGGTDAATALQRERDRAAAELERDRRRLDELDTLVAAESAFEYHVEVLELTERQVTVCGYGASFDILEKAVRSAIREVRANLRTSGRRRIGPWGATFPLDLSDEVDGHVFTAVDGDPGPLPTTTLPGGSAVSTVHHGGLDSVVLAYLSLFAEIDRLGGTPQAPVIEEYLSREQTRVSIPFTR